MAKRKDISILISAAGWIASFIGDLIALLRDRGISDEEIHALVTDDSSAKKLLGKIADAIVETIKSKKIIYAIAMEYATSVEDLLKAGNYDWRNGYITTKHFPTKRTGTIDSLEIEIVHFNRSISSDDAIAELDRSGFRPAEAGESLAYGAKYPDVQREFPIIALGSTWRDLNGNRNVLVLNCSEGKRMTNLSWFDNDWNDNCRFAAVRK